MFVIRGPRRALKMLILYCASNYPYAKYDRSNSSYKCERVAMGRTPWNIKDIITPYLLLGQLLSILEVLYHILPTTVLPLPLQVTSKLFYGSLSSLFTSRVLGKKIILVIKI